MRGGEIITLQQHFLPACKGVVKSLPSSLIADGTFQESNNVMFGEGFVEKCKGAMLFSDALMAQVTHIGLFSPINANPITIIFTTNNVYSLTVSTKTLTSIMPNTYSVVDANFISDCSIEGNYIFTNMVNDIYIWDGIAANSHILYGTYKPNTWSPATAYAVGNIVCPSDSKYNGFVYKCTTAGTSGEAEPTWSTGTDPFVDGTCYWQLCGGLELEGSGATSLRAKNIAYYKGFVVVANTEEDGTSYPQRLRWCQWKNPTFWHNDTDGSGLAGYVDCGDGTDPIMNIKVFGEYLVIYKQNSIQIISYTGDATTTFERTVVATEVGLLAPRAIITMPNLHIFVGQDNIYAFDLNDATAIGDDIRTEFFRLLNPSKRDRVFGFYDKSYPEVMFVFHSVYNTTDQPDMALTYNPQTKAWGFRDFGYSAIGQIVLTNDTPIDSITMAIDEWKESIDTALNQQNAAQTLLGDMDGHLYLQQGYTNPHGDYDGYVITKTHHMNTPELLKRLLRVQFHIETSNDYNLYVQIGYSNNAEAQMIWSDPIYLNLSDPIPPWVDCDITARYFAIRFGTKKNAQPFKILGYTLYYQTRTVQ